MLGLNFGLAPVLEPAGVACARYSLLTARRPPTGLAARSGAGVAALGLALGPRDGVRLMDEPTEGARVEPTPTEATRLTDARR
mgnify:CR=1 FL=1